ncbi:MAG TPA: hypothetical protein VFG58_06220 [Solirubrobacterales bacterium]|nr:hypothetical protein [Solirubrobacterales bacterium]
MRRGRDIGALLALAALSLAVPPAGLARAEPSAPQLYSGVARLSGRLALMGQGSSSLGLPRGRALAELRFVNRDGYTIAVTAFGQTVALDVSRARFRVEGRGRQRRRVRERVAETTYLAHGRVTPRSIEASFGDRGRIAMRFRPNGRKLHATRKAGCRRPNGAVIANLGSFHGELRFRGEGGFTSVEAHRIPGRSVNLRGLLACLLGISPKSDAALPPAHAPLGIHLPGLVAERAALRDGPNVPAVPTHPSGGPRSTTLVANRKEALARIVFAAQVRGDGRPRFLAVDQASEGSLGIVRLAYVRGDASAFAFDDILSSATVSPPPPFQGSAGLRRGPGNAKSWSGSLAVSFLGMPGVPLTGAPFGAWLSQGF